MTLPSSTFFSTFGESLFTILLILLGGVIATLMIISEFFLISQTSVLTLSVVGILKEVLTISLGVLVFGDQITETNFVGLAITLVGIITYNYIKVTKAAKHEPINFDSYDENGISDYIELDQNMNGRSMSSSIRSSFSGTDSFSNSKTGYSVVFQEHERSD
ncbi:hypothetical protein BB560_000378 [Smittium megazygosporum]|uniref:Sugar phosphate transporter domain-containing protein n=1 Tax=Smittium megazygosporum TaxID=133381 RepID=A0A2T9ZKI2_9FUNG|nr:hypothetical protein BB560_000378 [Smittium megazygosporum]